MPAFNQLSRWVALALVAGLTIATVAEAQQNARGRDNRGGQRGDRGALRGGRGGFPGGGFGAPDKVSLLGNPQVQQELQIASEQKLFLDDIIAEHREQQREIFSGVDFRALRDKPEAEREKLMAELQAKREKLSQKAEAGLQEFLSEDQIARLDQIALQLRGLRALTDDEVARKLMLSDEQKKKIEAVFEAEAANRRRMFEEMRNGSRDRGDAPRGRGNFDFTAMREKMEEARKKTESEVLAVLTASQKSSFDAMKGKPFELERRGFGGRPSGGRPDDPGRPRGEDGGRPPRPAAE